MNARLLFGVRRAALWGLVAVAAGCSGAEEPEDWCPGCEQECSPGAVRCLGNAVQSCDAAGRWLRAVDCPLGTACESGICASSCAPESCLPGTLRCAEEGPQRCGTTPEGCGEWEAPRPCQPGARCMDGACRSACAGGCAVGERRCVDGGHFSECGGDPACPGFGEPQPCGAGEVCSAGECRPAEGCVDACPPETVGCLDARRAQTCAPGAAGCLEWGGTVDCGPEGECRAGVGCVDACPDPAECQPGSAQCAPEGGGRQGCVLGPGDCPRWGEVTACPGDEVCEGAGQCAASCPEGCALDSERCAPEGGGVERCERVDGCPRWVRRACPEGAGCTAEGRCGDCVDGATEEAGCGQCGVQSRTCAAGAWGEYGACGGEGACAPGTSEGCGNCGMRRCGADCQWGPCEGQGACAPEAREDCGECGFRVCNAQCGWGDCGNGDGRLFRRCNDCGWQFCCPNGNWCPCAARYDCPGGQSCVGAGVCQ